MAVSRESVPYPLASNRWLPHWTWFALAAILALYCSSFLVWHSLDRNPVELDQPVYYGQSIKFYQEIERGDVAAVIMHVEAGTNNRAQPLRPVLVPLLTSLSFLIFGPSRDTALLTPLLWSILLLVILYLIGWEWLGPKVGLLASFIMLMLPLFVILSRHYYLEIPLAALCAATVYMLIRKDAFLRPLSIVAIGVLAGISLLVMETYPLFVAGSFAGALIYDAIFRPNGLRLPSLLTRYGFAAAISFAIAAPFYLPRLRRVTSFLGSAYSSVNSAQFHGFGTTSRPDLVTAFTYMFVQFGVSLAFSLAFFAAGIAVVVYVFRRRGKDAHRNWARSLVVLAPWLVVPYLAAATSFANDLRYILPALPAFALLLAATLMAVQWRSLRVGLVGIVLMAGFGQFYMVSFADRVPRLNFASTPRDIYSLYQAHGAPGIQISSYVTQIDSLAIPQHDDWKTGEIISALNARRKRAGLRVARVFVVPGLPSFNRGALETIVLFGQYPLKMSGSEGNRISTLLPSIRQSDYLVVKDGPIGLPVAGEIMDAMPTFGFRPTSDRFLLPDGTQATIYERTSPR